jgi:mannosyltransferase OCH1-like enzyme
MIPKTIHYCWLSGYPIPEKLKKYMHSWQEKLSGYEFIFWDFDRFDISNSLWVKQAFAAKKYASAADVIRLFAVYKYGGIYLDMDVEVIKPFDDLLEKDIMLAYENNKNKCIEAGCFGAEKEHPFIKACYDYFTGKEFSQKTIEDGYTLPRIMKKVLKNSQEFRRIYVYDEDYFTAKKFRTGVVKMTRNTYTVHHFAGSWVSEQEKVNQKTSERIVATFGDNVLSIFIILCIAFISRVKKHGLLMTIRYYVRQLYK